MTYKHSNDSGVAYGWFMIGAFILLGAFSYFCTMAIYNSVISTENSMINAGTSSEATKDAMSFNRDIALYLPVIMLIGVFIWAMVRGIGGSGATFQTFYFGYTILFLCCFVSLLMAFAGGIYIDNFYSALDDRGMIGSPGLSEEWSSVQIPNLYTLMNMFYGLCYIIPFVGLAVFFQSIARRTSGSQYIRGY